MALLNPSGDTHRGARHHRPRARFKGVGSLDPDDGAWQVRAEVEVQNRGFPRELVVESHTVDADVLGRVERIHPSGFGELDGFTTVVEGAGRPLELADGPRNPRYRERSGYWMRAAR